MWRLSFLFLLITASAQARTRYVLEWDFKGLPIEVKTARAPRSERTRVAETGVVTPAVSLPIQAQMADGSVELERDDVALIYLFVNNKSQSTLYFSVSPHSTHPGSHALGFVFNCLCNGHIYEVPPGQVWYRLMELRTQDLPQDGRVVLKHKIFKVKKPKP